MSNMTTNAGGATNVGSSNDASNTNQERGGGGRTSIAGVPPGAIPIGRLFGVPIQLHYSYFLLLALALIGSIRFRSGRYTLYEFCLMGPILFVTILCHELGHVLMARKLGGQSKCIVLWPLGGLAISSQPNPHTHRSTLLVAFAGPATHIVQMVFWVIFTALVGLATPTTYWGTNPYYIVNGTTAEFFVMVGLGALYLNLALMCFNLFLPAYPLDGGQIFASMLLMNGNPPERAAKITSITAGVIGLILLVWAIVSFFYNQNPFTILNILVSLWIMSTSYELYKLVQVGRVREHPLFNSSATNSSSNNNSGATGANAV